MNSECAAGETNVADYRQLLNLFNQREYGQVIAQVEKLPIESPPKVTELQSIYLAAESYYAIGNYKRSQEYVEFWLANCGSAGNNAIGQLAPYCRFRLAQIHANSDRGPEAIELIQKLLKEPIPATLKLSASLQLAWLLAESDVMSSEARMLCDTCVAETKENSHDRLSAMLLKSVLTRHNQDLNASNELLEEVRERCGNSEPLRELRYKATVLLLQVKNSTGESSMSDRLVQDLKSMAPPNQRLYELAKLESMIAIKDEDNVALKVRELTTLGQTAKDATVRQRATLALVRMNNSECDHKAICDCCSNLLKNDALSPDLRAELYFRNANSLYKTGDAQAAIDRLTASVESMPNSTLWRSPSVLLLAEVAYQLEKLPLARKTYLQILEEPGLSQSAEVRYLAILRLGEIAAIESDWIKADEYARSLRQATDGFNYTAASNYLLGRISVAKGELDEARSQLKSAVDAAGKETEIAARAQWLIGETYFLQENYPRALENYAAVLAYEDQPQWCAVSQLQSAKCMEAEGKWSDAASIYQHVVKQYPNSIYIEETLQRLTTAQEIAATHLAEKKSTTTR